ncbi:hypothetical protein, partial [Leptospira borgpetersenii]|uniref:hypothetical protein n=1 Tax=Leptospira borgpetersenii TaxID=174 RepID=UPI0027DB4D61
LHPVPYSVNSFVKTVITLSVFALGTISQPKRNRLYASVIVNGRLYIGKWKKTFRSFFPTTYFTN